MDTKRFLIGAVVGLVVFNVLGFLTFDMALGGFYEANAGSATGVEREAPIFWAAGVAGLLHGALLVMVMDWAGVGSVGGGVQGFGTRRPAVLGRRRLPVLRIHEPQQPYPDDR